MKKNIFVTAFVLVLVAPAVSFAALQGVQDLLTSATTIINMVIPIVFGLALIYFFWGLANFILHADEQEARDNGKQKMFWGIVALFVIVSIYGILTFVGNTVGINPDSGSSNTTTGSSYGTPGDQI
jgi:D-alanyl-lipoteichoic acid acyltransferase DltB (MBOAT superfamily)